MTFTVDGVDYSDLVVNTKRTAEVRSSDLSGLLLDRTYFNDAIGTYLTYEVEISVPYGKEALYASLYEALSDPVSGHEFVLPYNQTTVQLTGRVETISDAYHHKNSKGVHFWRDTVFSIIANEPSKTG